MPHYFEVWFQLSPPLIAISPIFLACAPARYVIRNTAAGGIANIDRKNITGVLARASATCVARGAATGAVAASYPAMTAAAALCIGGAGTVAAPAVAGIAGGDAVGGAAAWVLGPAI